MAVELYRSGEHTCLGFYDLVTGDGIQSNQFLIVDGNESMLLDPGGALTYTPLTMAMAPFVRPKQLTYVFASHQDPDIIASVDRWFLYTNCKIVVSRLWGRFVPHLVPGYMKEKGMDRYVLIPDNGGEVRLGGSVLKILPAHFLHSTGNLHVYDVTSKILFSGDMGASLTDKDPSHAVDDFDRHVARMKGFHQRYMASNKMCRLWAEMVSNLDIEMMVPQHGQPFVGREMVQRFINWIAELPCGVDLFSQRDFQVP
ncbi:MAG: FprA family A-type flavoprotein [Chromatiales bacterium]|nr:FprA family A-type flavoprotein [Chromatiales bacterium]